MFKYATISSAITELHATANCLTHISTHNHDRHALHNVAKCSISDNGMLVHIKRYRLLIKASTAKTIGHWYIFIQYEETLDDWSKFKLVPWLNNTIKPPAMIF